jgi:hypothetical protein
MVPHLWNQYFFVVSRVSSASELTGNSDLILLQQKTVLQTGKIFIIILNIIIDTDIQPEEGKGLR